MNETSLENFKKELNQIREYLKHIQYVNDLANYSIPISNDKIAQSLLDFLKEHYRSFGRDKRIFEYKASVISLYGLLEKYIETWIKEYLDSLSHLVPNYNQIDEKIKNNHFLLSLKLIENLTRGSLKYQHLTKEEVLRKLNTCIVSPTEYSNKINTEAFFPLSGNLKHNKIVELFKLLNIELNNKLIKNENLNSEIGLTDKNSRIEKDILYNKINDLVERRNEIAHGAEVSEILDISGLEPYIQFLEKYCQAIFEVLFEELIQYEVIHKFQKIEKVVDIFRDAILAFEIEDYRIKVGDILIVETKEGKFYKKIVFSIELDNIPHQELTISGKQKISVSVEPKIKKNQTFYLRR